MSRPQRMQTRHSMILVVCQIFLASICLAEAFAPYRNYCPLCGPTDTFTWTTTPEPNEADKAIIKALKEEEWLDYFIRKLQIRKKVDEDDLVGSEFDELYTEHLIDSPVILDKFMGTILKELDKIKLKKKASGFISTRKIIQILTKLEEMKSQLTF